VLTGTIEHPSVEIALGRDHLWFGLEVEGIGSIGQKRLTAFIAAPLNPREMERFQSRVASLHAILLGQTFNDWTWYQTELEHFVRRYQLRVVCERTPESATAFLLDPISKNIQCHLIVQCPEALLLRPSDEVVIGQPFHVCTFIVSDGILTQPIEYAADTLA
jgi:hypothetical protein